MVIQKLVVTDKDGVEHVFEGTGYVHVRSQNYRAEPMTWAVDAHIPLDDKEKIPNVFR